MPFATLSASCTLLGGHLLWRARLYTSIPTFVHASTLALQWVAGGDHLLQLAGASEDRRASKRPCTCGTGSLVSDLRRRTDRLIHEVAYAGIKDDLAGLRETADRFSGDENECARILFAILGGYSNLITKLMGASLNRDSPLGAVAHLKEAYGKQRAFVVGVGSLPKASLAALPPRAVVLILNVHEEIALWRNRAEAHALRLAPARKARLERALSVDDARMAQMGAWLCSDAFDLASLHAKLATGPLSSALCWELWTGHVDKLQSLEDGLLREHYEDASASEQMRRTMTHLGSVGATLALAMALAAGALSPLLPPPIHLWLAIVLALAAAAGLASWAIGQRRAKGAVAGAAGAVAAAVSIRGIAFALARAAAGGAAIGGPPPLMAWARARSCARAQL